MKTKIIAAFTALVIMTGVAIMGIGPASAAPYDSFVQTIIDRTNALRVENGLAPVAYDSQISGVSQEWAEHLYTETQDPMWDSSTVHRHDAGLSQFPGAVYASENVAINADADRIFAAWRDSPGHRANMLSPDVQSIGIGYIQQTAGPYAGQFIAVENFAGYGTQATPVATPADPSVIDASTLSIPAVDGVEYTINGVLAAPGPHTVSGLVSVDARAVSGWELAAGSNTHWTFNFTAETQVTPFAPEFNNAAKTYTIPATEGVEYFVAGLPVAAGTYDGAGTVTVNAYAADGYVINAGSATEWTHTYTEVVTQTPVTPAEPTFNDTAFNYTVPSTSGVDYLVNGEFVRAGTYTPNTSSVTITAQAQNGFVIAEGATTTWGFTYGSSTVYVVPNAPVFSDADRTYLVPSSPGVKYGVNGSIVEAGTYPVDANGATINIDAFAQDGYAMHEGTQSNWSHTFAAVETPAADVEVEVVAPTTNEAARTVTIPTVEGVEYLVNGEVATGTLTAGNGATTYTITARALEGYKLTNAPQSPWTFSFAAVADPATPVKVEAPAPVVDEATRTITIPNVEGVEYLVNGEVATGVVKVGPATATFNVAARALRGYELSNTSTEPWTITMAAAPTTPIDTPATPGTPPSDNDVVVAPPADPNIDTPATPGTPPSDNDVVVAPPASDVVADGNGNLVVDANGDVVADGNRLGACPADGGPFYAGDAEYSTDRDGDNDGVACEDGKGLADTGANANVLLYGGIAGIAFLLLSGAAYGFVQRRKVTAGN